jgi:hypothetical protein
VTLTNDVVEHNAQASTYVGYGGGHGGGIFIASDAAVYLDSTAANTMFNTPDNIEGTYTLLS